MKAPTLSGGSFMKASLGFAGRLSADRERREAAPGRGGGPVREVFVLATFTRMV
jgi:hypothetical protein